MTESLQVGLIITAIGMGLVFGAIILLWSLMALIVRIGAQFEGKPETPIEVPAKELIVESSRQDKKLVAVAALAVAMALKERSRAPSASQLENQGSSWVQIQRAQAVQEKSRLFSSRQNRRS